MMSWGQELYWVLKVATMSGIGTGGLLDLLGKAEQRSCTGEDELRASISQGMHPKVARL